MFDPAASERDYTAKSVIQHAQEGNGLDLSEGATRILGELLECPKLLYNAGAEKWVGVSTVWHLGLLVMARKALDSIVSMQAEDETFAIRAHESKEVAAALLRAMPDFLEVSNSETQGVLWRLCGYNLATFNERDPLEMVHVLEVLKHASYIPPDLLERMRHYRDTAATMEHHPYMAVFFRGDLPPVADERYPSERECELAEAGTRVWFGAFVARYTELPQDQSIARAAVEAYCDQVGVDIDGLTDALGLAHGLAVNGGFDQGTYGPHLLAMLQERISQSIAGISLADVPLQDFLPLADVSYAYCKHFKNQTADILAAYVRPKLEEWERFFEQVEGRPEVALRFPPQHTDLWGTPQKQMQQVMCLWQKGENTKPTAQSVITQLHSGPLTERTIQEAFALVSSELDGAVKIQLEVDINAALAKALEQLTSGAKEPESPESLIMRNERALGMLSHFPAGREFIIDCSLKFAELFQGHLRDPGQFLRSQPYPDFAAASALAQVYEVFHYAWRAEDSSKIIRVLEELQAAIEGTIGFIKNYEQQGGEIKPGSLRIVDEVIQSSQALMAQVTMYTEQRLYDLSAGYSLPVSPVEALLAYYRRLSC